MNTHPNYSIIILAVFLVVSCEKPVTTEMQKPVNPFTFLTTNDPDLKFAITEYLNKNTFPASTISEFDSEKLMLLGDKTTKTGVILMPNSDESRFLFFSITEDWITKGLIMEVEKIENQAITAIIKTPVGTEIVEATFDAKNNSLKSEKILKAGTEEEWLCALLFYGVGAVVGASYGELVREALIEQTLKTGKGVMSASKLTAIGAVASLAYAIYTNWACLVHNLNNSLRYYDPVRIPDSPNDSPYLPYHLPIGKNYKTISQ